jgi:hypothetical protein
MNLDPQMGTFWLKTRKTRGSLRPTRGIFGCCRWALLDFAQGPERWVPPDDACCVMKRPFPPRELFDEAAIIPLIAQQRRSAYWGLLGHRAS